MREDIKILSVDCSEFNCPICFQVFQTPIITTCGHNFCAKCISQWTQKKKQCPCCRKLYYNDTFYQKDEIMAQKVGKLEIACQKCNKWNGLIKELKLHRLDQCSRSFKSENQPIQYQVIQDDPVDPTQTIMQELLSIKNQQNYIKLIQMDNENFFKQEIPLKSIKINKNRKRKVNKKQKIQEDQDVQFLQQDEIIKLKQSKDYVTKQINKRFKFQNNFLKEINEKNYRIETKYYFASLIYYRNLFLFHKLIPNQF